ncbi:MAG: RNA polymerase sigma factor [Saprospiraceae bacterium]|nr:RNA polymerase sigma factor [Bacteroidia bacterium]NNE16574.1 RNA polymerase sigma factor [Saprospiraceae bacterium]NNL93091.1 RNA polymerase sigma factor [Saprospiraceae bacterium]
MKPDFQKILQDHNDIIYKISKSFAFENYQDLYQEIAIEIWRSLEKFRGEAQIKTWIYRVAFNTAVSYSTKVKRQVVNNIPIDPAEIKAIQENYQTSKEQAAASKTKVNLLYQCINMLVPVNRSIIILQLEGHDYEEISQITGIKINTIGVKLNRIRNRLFQLLKDNGYERL